MRFNRVLYALHRWVALVILAQLSVWALTGAFFALVSHEQLHGARRDRGGAPALAVDGTVLGPAEVLRRLGARGVMGVTALELRPGRGGPYWLALRGIDPPAEAKKLGLPVLVLHGGRDYQVTAKDLSGWKAALGDEPRATIRLFPSVNHLFVAGEGPSTPAEYERPGHVAPEVVEAIAAWALALPPRSAP